MPITITHALSMTTPDNPAYENKPTDWNKTHAATMVVSATEISGLFSNANGISFGLSDSSITASYVKFSNGLTNAGNTAGDTGVVTGRVVLVGTNNITLSGSTNGGSMTISISGGAGAAGNTGYVSAGTATASLGTLSIADSNGVTFGIDGQTLTATVKTDYLTSQSNQALSGSNGSFTFQTATFGNLNGLSFYSSNGSMVGSYTVPTVTNSSWTVSDAATSLTISRLAFTNSNGLTLSLSTAAGAATVIGSYTVPTQSNQTGGIYVTAQSTGQSSSSTYDLRTLSITPDGIISAGWSGGSFRISATQSNQAFSADASSTFQTLTFQNSNGFTFSNNAGAIRASYSVPVVSNAIQAVGSATGSGTNTSRFAADDHVHLGVYSAGVSNVGNTAGNTGPRPGQIVFAGSNALTLSQETAANSLQTVHIQGPLSATTISGVTSANVIGTRGSRFALEDHQHVGVYSIGVSTGGNTAGDTAVRPGQLVLVGGNNITLSGGTAAGSLQTITIVGPSPGAAQFSVGVSNLGNTAGATGVTGTRIVLVGTNGVTLSQTTDATGATISFSAGGGAGGMNFQLSGATSGDTTVSGTTVVMSGINLTLSGTNGSQMALSAPATSSLVGTNGITISTNGSTISVSQNILSSWGAMQDPPNAAATMGQSVSHAVAISIGAPLSASFMRIPVSMTTRSTTISTLNSSMNASAEIYSTWNVVAYSLGTGASSRSLLSVASGSNGWTQRNSISVAANGTQYSVTLAFSAQAEGAGTTRTTQYSISNTNYSLTTQQIVTEWSGLRFLDVNFANSLTPGPYWIIFGVSTNVATNSTRFSAATNCGAQYSQNYGVSGSNAAWGIMGSTNFTSGGPFGGGSFSTAGGGTTSRLPLSAISSNASNWNPGVFFLRSA